MSSDHVDLVRAQIEREIDSLRAAPPLLDGSLASRLMHQQGADRIGALTNELAGLDSEVFELAFSEKESAASHQLPTTVLANLLSRFQRAVTYAGWARVAGPGVHGRIPSIVSKAFETQVNAFAHGSFVVELDAHEQALENVALHDALADFLKLASSAAEDPDGPEASDDVKTLAQELGPEATRRFALFFAKIREADLQARFEWAGFPEAQVVLLPAQAGKLATWLNSVEQHIEPKTVVGRLTAADANEGRFAVTDSAEEIHEGKAAPELLANAVIDRQYRAVLRVTTFKSVVTGTITSRKVLESLSPVDD